jgi:thioredoxin 1
MSTILLIVAGILIIALFVISKLKNAPMVENHQDIMVLTDQNFEKSLENKVVLVDFWAAWCTPCKMVAPILNDLSSELSEGKTIGKVDVDAYPKLAQKFGIRSIPTLVLFKNGKEVERFVGIKQKNFLKQQMDKY